MSDDEDAIAAWRRQQYPRPALTVDLVVFTVLDAEFMGVPSLLLGASAETVYAPSIARGTTRVARSLEEAAALLPELVGLQGGPAIATDLKRFDRRLGELLGLTQFEEHDRPAKVRSHT